MKKIISNVVINKILRDEESKKRGERIKVVSVVDSTVFYKWSEYIEDSINIYELLFKTKEYIREKQDIDILTTWNEEWYATSVESGLALEILGTIEELNAIHVSTGESELEAFFKECEWLLMRGVK